MYLAPAPNDLRQNKVGKVQIQNFWRQNSEEKSRQIRWSASKNNENTVKKRAIRQGHKHFTSHESCEVLTVTSFWQNQKVKISRKLYVKLSVVKKLW